MIHEFYTHFILNKEHVDRVDLLPAALKDSSRFKPMSGNTLVILGEVKASGTP